MSAEHARPIFVAILGTDALLAARPVEPVQLTRACRIAGFDFVAPVTWGEEVIATWIARHTAGSNGSCSVVAAVCPLAIEQLQATPVQTSVVEALSPPVATARYLRAAFQPRRVHVTYVGACPGAAHPEIDLQCLPESLFSKLLEAGIDVTRQPRHLDGQFPVERARYASTPGGVPDANWLLSQSGPRVVEAAPITADVVVQLHRDASVLVDVAAACRCICARDRTAVARNEPPRSSSPVIADLPISVGKAESTHVVEEPQPQQPPEPIDLVENRKAKYAENGLSFGDVVIPPVLHTLSKALEPW